MPFSARRTSSRRSPSTNTSSDDEPITSTPSKNNGKTVVPKYKRRYWFTLWLLLGIIFMFSAVNIQSQTKCNVEPMTVYMSNLVSGIAVFWALCGAGSIIYSFVYLFRTKSDS